MDYEVIRNFPEKEFYELAISQIEKFPDLLLMLTEDEIIHNFYEYYKRKKVNA